MKFSIGVLVGFTMGVLTLAGTVVGFFAGCFVGMKGSEAASSEEADSEESKPIATTEEPTLP